MEKIGNERGITSSQKLMIFVLSMSIYGLATLFTELLPKFYVGVVEFSVEYFLFIPLVLAILFDPMSAALGAATGEVIFSEIMLGQFGGIGEIEKFIRITMAVYIVGRLVKDPLNKKMIALAVFVGLILDLGTGTLVDIGKVQIGVEDFEAVEGLPESIWATEGFAFLNDMLFSGILFVLLPTLYLVPKLYGKIEPLLGTEPRTRETQMEAFDFSLFIKLLVAAAVAFGFEALSESGFELISWETDWAESGTAIAIAMVIAALIAVVAILAMRKKEAQSQSKQ